MLVMGVNLYRNSLIDAEEYLNVSRLSSAGAQAALRSISRAHAAQACTVTDKAVAWASCRPVFLKLIWPATPFLWKKILSGPSKRINLCLHHTSLNETFKLKFFKLFIEIHWCKIHNTNKIIQ